MILTRRIIYSPPLMHGRFCSTAQATQVDNINRVGYTTATININYNHPKSPVFADNIVELRVTENVPIGTRVMRAHAEDNHPVRIP